MPYGPPIRYGQLITREGQKKLAHLKYQSTPCTLQINTCNPSTLAVTATLRDANRPGGGREFKGKIMAEPGTGRILLYFPVQGTGQRRERLLETDFNLLTAPESLTLELSGDRLVGKMPGPLSPDVFWFELECAAGEKSR